MSNTLYVYENGSCRGNIFIHRMSFNISNVIEMMKNTKHMEEGDLDEYMEDIYDCYDYDKAVFLCELCVGGTFFPNDKGTQKEWLDKLVNNQPFAVETEESTFGVGVTKQDALNAYAKVLEEENMDWG